MDIIRRKNNRSILESSPDLQQEMAPSFFRKVCRTKGRCLLFMCRESYVGKKLSAAYQSREMRHTGQLKPAKKACSVLPEYNNKLRNPPKIKDLLVGEEISESDYSCVYSLAANPKHKSSKTPNKLKKEYVVKSQNMRSYQAKKAVNQEINLQRSISFASKVVRHETISTGSLSYAISVMEHRGIDLKRFISYNNQAAGAKCVDDALTHSVALQFMKQIAFLHSRGIAHRDIKPKNILVDHKGMVTIIDYGIAQQKANAKSQIYSGFCGSIKYMAPEIFDGTLGSRLPYTAAVDIWSSALVLYYLLSGNPPAYMYGYGTAKHLDTHAYDDFIQKIKNDKSVSASAKDVIIAMLNTDPEKRLGIDELLQHPFFAEEKSIDEIPFAELQTRHITAFNELAKYENMKINIKAGKMNPAMISMKRVNSEILRLQNDVKCLQDEMKKRLNQ